MSSYTDESKAQCMLEKNIALLQEIPFFESFSPQICKLIAYLAKRNVLEKGDVIFSEGDDPAQCIYILSGSFSFHSKKFAEQNPENAKAGDLISSASLLASTHSLFTMTAAEESEILSFEREGFLKIVEQSPEIYRVAVQSLVKNIENWEYQMLQKNSSLASGVSLL